MDFPLPPPPTFDPFRDASGHVDMEAWVAAVRVWAERVAELQETNAAPSGGDGAGDGGLRTS